MHHASRRAAIKRTTDSFRSLGVRTATTPPAPARPPCTLGEVVKLVGTGRVGKGFDSFLRPWRITEFFRKQLLCACAHISQPDWQIPRQIRATGNPLWKFLEFQCTWNFPWISVFYPWNANPLPVGHATATSTSHVWRLLSKRYLVPCKDTHAVSATVGPRGAHL